jgi:hypothetical protein
VVAEALGGIGTNVGVSAEATNGITSTGVYGYADSASNHAIGVEGYAVNDNTGFYSATGVKGRAEGAGEHSYGVFGESQSTSDWSYGVYGHALNSPNANIGVSGFADQPLGFKRGGNFQASGDGTNHGVYAHAYNGSENYSIYGNSSGNAPTDYAGYFNGDVHVNGTLSKNGGSFKIDHPLDPENKYLQHSFVESPDMMNIYNGNVVTDINGLAEVKLPEYFEALNIDFRYQLTVIGEFAQAIVLEKIHDNRFVVKTDKPNVEVSWQVTGIRNDRWAQQNRIEVEVEKLPFEQGKYLNPELYGLDRDQGIHIFEDIPADTPPPGESRGDHKRGQK